MEWDTVCLLTNKIRYLEVMGLTQPHKNCWPYSFVTMDWGWCSGWLQCKYLFEACLSSPTLFSWWALTTKWMLSHSLSRGTFSSFGNMAHNLQKSQATRHGPLVHSLLQVNHLMLLFLCNRRSFIDTPFAFMHCGIYFFYLNLLHMQQLKLLVLILV